MGVGALEKKGGKFDVNGLIEDYYVYAGENISAGSFVEFVNNGVAGQTTKESSAVQIGTKTGDEKHAIVIDEKTAFIVFNCGYKLYGVVVTIENGVIIAGTDVALETTNYSATRLIRPVLLPSGAVFVIYINTSSSSNDRIAGMICEIEGLVPTKKKTATIVTADNASMDRSAVLISENQVFIAHSYGSTYRLYGIVVTIADDYSMTVGTDTILGSTTNYFGYRINTGLLEIGKVIVAHASNNVNTGNMLCAKVCTIDGTTITYGNSTMLDSDISSGKTISALQVLQKNKAVILHRANNTDNALCATLVTVDGDSIAVETQQNITTNYAEAGGAFASSTLLKDNKIFIAGRGDSSTGILSIVIIDVDIDNNIITQGVDTIITTPLSGSNADGYNHSCDKIDDDTVFVCYGATKYGQLFGIDYENNLVTTTIKVKQYETQIRNVTSSNANGIAKTSGVGGSSTAHGGQVSVYIPNSYYWQYNLVENGDFSAGLNNWNYYTTVVEEMSVVNENGVNVVKFNTVDTLTTSSIMLYQTDVEISSDGSHIYYVCAYIKGETDVNTTDYFRMSMVGTLKDVPYVYPTTDWRKVSATYYNVSVGQIRITGYSQGINNYFAKDVRAYDLTAIFGAGNEPTRAWCDANL